MSDASVRTATTADLSAVGEVQAAVWRDAFGEILEQDTVAAFAPEPFAAAWRESLADPPSTIHRLLVATELDDIVGFIAIGPTEQADGGEILAGGVHPDRRHHGHGSRLLNAAIDTLAASDRTFVRTRIVERDTPLVRFLAEAGFVASGGYADRVVTSAGGTIREIEMHTVRSDDGDPAPHDHQH